MWHLRAFNTIVASSVQLAGAHNKTYTSIHKFTAESETATDLNNPTLTGLLNHKKRKQKEMDNILAGTYLNTTLIN